MWPVLQLKFFSQCFTIYIAASMIIKVTLTTIALEWSMLLTLRLVICFRQQNKFVYTKRRAYDLPTALHCIMRWCPQKVIKPRVVLRTNYFWRMRSMNWGAFKNADVLLNLRAPNITTLYKNNIFQCVGKVYCAEFQKYPLRFHTKYLTHTLKDVYCIHRWQFKRF